MGVDSKIEWTDHTFNPWWGCTRVSPGCEHCYAEAFAKRTGLQWGVKAERRFFGEKHWSEPLKWNRAAKKAGERRRVFCASMADVFEEHAGVDPWRLRLFELIDKTSSLDWLLLTKRPQNMVLVAPRRWECGWPENVWAGCTVEDQARADERIPHLLRVPAAVRFLSCEPMLGPVDLAFSCFNGADSFGTMPGVGWVIVGGESGPGARPFNVAWARSIVEQCKAAEVPAFVKQMGAAWARDNRINGYDDAKGGDPERWPPDLRVREYPR